MKKLISAAIALSMAASAFAPCVCADEGLEKIIVDVKSRAGITDEYDDFSSDYISETDKLTEYQFSWNTKEENKSVSVDYNSDDIITYYRSFGDKKYKDSLSLPKISVDEAKKAAQEFLDRINPSVKGEYVAAEPNRSSGALSNDYSFRVDRMKNGVEVNGFYGNIEVDRENAEVYSMWLSYSHVDEFEDVSSVIPAEDAKDAFKEKPGLELVYCTYYDDKRVVVFPAYKEASDSKYISAVTGEVYEPEISAGIYRFSAESSAADAAEKYEAGVGLSGVEINELEKIDGLLSKADAEKKVRTNKTLDIPSDLKLTSINLQRDYYDDTQYAYSMYFSNDTESRKIHSAHVSIDAKTGEIKSYYGFESDFDKEKNELNDEKVQKSAERIFNELAGSKKSEYRFEKVCGNTVIYRRYVNDVKVMSDTINISVDANGSLTSYNAGYTSNAEFPSVEGVMNADEAADKLFEAVDYDVKYYLVTEDEKSVAKALYMFKDYPGYVNPFTGAVVDYRNEEVSENAVYEYSDISDHYAKNQIETLAEYGIGFEGGEYKPDVKITQRDFLYLLLKISHTYIDFNDDNELYRIAETDDLIDERDDTAEITRGDMAKIMIRFMGAEEFAGFDGIFVSPFNDVTEKIGYSAILYAMGIVKGDEKGNFNPQNIMTRAEAACVIYNYLNR